MTHASTSFRPLLTCHLLRDVHPGILPQTYTHFLFSYIALLFFTAHVTTWQYIVSCLFITDFQLNVDSMGKDLELCIAYPWCLNSAHGGSSVIVIEWKKTFWKSSLQVNCYDHITPGLKQTTKKGTVLERKGNWNRRENQTPSLAAWATSLWENNSSWLELRFLTIKWEVLTRWFLKTSHSKVSLIL